MQCKKYSLNLFIFTELGLTAKKRGIIFFTEKEEAITDQAGRIPGEIGSDAEAADTPIQR